jgi:hypothetical protein
VTRPVYSTCFLVVADSFGSFTYTVPAGDTAIVSDMSLWVRDDGGAPGIIRPVTVALEDAGSIIWQVQPNRALAGSYQWSGRQVFTTSLIFDSPDIWPFVFRACGVILTPT